MTANRGGYGNQLQPLAATFHVAPVAQLAAAPRALDAMPGRSYPPVSLTAAVSSGMGSARKEECLPTFTVGVNGVDAAPARLRYPEESSP